MEANLQQRIEVANEQRSLQLAKMKRLLAEAAYLRELTQRAISAHDEALEITRLIRVGFKTGIGEIRRIADEVLEAHLERNEVLENTHSAHRGIAVIEKSPDKLHPS